MFDRALSVVITSAAAGAAAVLAVFASGFALFAFVEPHVGTAGAAAIVALAAALSLSLAALVMTLQAHARERREQAERASAMNDLPQLLSGLIEDRPLLSLALSAGAGLLAATNSSLLRDIAAILARSTRR
jgi:K+-sensing histidine kinase KdpD